MIYLSNREKTVYNQINLKKLLVNRAGTIHRYILIRSIFEKPIFDLWNIDQGKQFQPYLFLLSFYYNYSILTNENSRYPSGKPKTVMFRLWLLIISQLWVSLETPSIKKSDVWTHFSFSMYESDSKRTTCRQNKDGMSSVHSYCSIQWKYNEYARSFKKTSL